MGLLHTMNTRPSDDILERRVWKALEMELCPWASKANAAMHVVQGIIISHNALYYSVCLFEGNLWGNFTIGAIELAEKLQNSF